LKPLLQVLTEEDRVLGHFLREDMAFQMPEQLLFQADQPNHHGVRTSSTEEDAIRMHYHDWLAM